MMGMFLTIGIVFLFACAPLLFLQAAAAIATVIGAGASAYGALRGGRGRDQVGWVPPPREALKMLEKSRAREAGDLRRAGVGAQRAVSGQLMSRGLGSTTLVGAKTSEVQRRTQAALADLSERYGLAKVGGYQPYVQEGPDYSAFGDLLMSAGQAFGLGLGGEGDKPALGTEDAAMTRPMGALIGQPLGTGFQGGSQLMMQGNEPGLAYILSMLGQGSQLIP